MFKLPYTKLEKILNLGGIIVICLAYVLMFLGFYSQEDSIFVLVILSLLYIFLLLFEYYPQTTNIVTSKKYNNSNEDDKRAIEHKIRLVVSALRCILAISCIFLIF